MLEPRLSVGVAAEGGLVVGAGLHLTLERLQLLLDREQLASAREHVVAQRELALARWALVVQRHPRPLADHQLAPVHRGLAGQHSQQGRLAGTVAPRQRHAIAALELERHPAQQRFSGNVLAQV